MNRRSFLRSSVGATLSTGVAGIAGVTGVGAAAQASGIVWSQRGSAPGTQTLLDVVPGTDDAYICCGYTARYASESTLVQTADRWGRVRSSREGSEANERGHRGYELRALDEGFLLAGVEDGAPKLLRTAHPMTRADWAHSFDGEADGAIHVATTGATHAVGWTDAGDQSGAAVAATDAEGTEQWTDSLASERRLTALVATGGDGTEFAAVGTGDDGGWAVVLAADGTRERDRTLTTPGSGPEAAVTDGDGVVLAGSGPEGWWLQRRDGEWAVDWTRTYADDGATAEGGVDDLVVRSDGYGLLAHEGSGAVVVRADGSGERRWRARYAPQDGGGHRGHALVPVDGDEFVIAGATTAGEGGPDWWRARVGQPGETTPVEPPERTATPGPTTSPPPIHARTTEEGSATDDTAGETDASTPVPVDGTERPTGTGTPTPDGDATTASSGDGPGFGPLAALAGLSGWLATRVRDE